MKKHLLVICAVVLAICLTAFTYESKRFATATLEYVGPDFAMGDASGPLDDDANYTEANPSCANGENKVYFCKATYIYVTVKPTEKQIRDAIKAEYDRLAALNLTYTDGYTFNVVLNGETVSIQVFLKDTN